MPAPARATSGRARRPSLHDGYGVAFDFRSGWPVDLPDCCFLLFLKIRFAHDRRLATRRLMGSGCKSRAAAQL